jgi:tetratricopeptide (TPR) repeat protein
MVTFGQLSRLSCLVMWLSVAVSAFAQAKAGSTYGFVAPPELSGPDATIPTISDSDKPYAEAFVTLLKDLKMTEADLPKIDQFLAQYPQNDIAYFWRGNIEACVAKPFDLVKARRDLEEYRSIDHSELFPSQDQDALSLLAKIELSEGHPVAAVGLMKRAAMGDLRLADNIFNATGVKPESTSTFCTWNLTDLHQLAEAAPHDPWPHILIGLYYQFFTRFGENSFSLAAAEYRKAANLDSHAAVIPYLQGELYNKATFLLKQPWASVAAKSGETGLAMFTKALTLDPKFTLAYAARAEIYLEAKQPALAVRDFEKALALDPKIDTCLSDKGIAESDLGRYYDAIQDFGEALRVKGEEDIYRPQLYQNRGDAYAKVNDLRRAVDDYSAAIHLRLKSQIAVLTIAQFRGIYPEYKGVSDEMLTSKLNRYFMPQMAQDMFEKMIRDNTGKMGISLLNDLYEARGSAYLASGDYIDGIRDFQRIFVGIPNYADSTDRWRQLGKAGNGEAILIDVKGSDVSTGSEPRIWLKRVGAKQSTVLSFAVDCPGKRVRTATSVIYDLKNNAIGEDESGSVWGSVTPDTIGEQVWAGICEAKP